MCCYGVGCPGGGGGGGSEKAVDVSRLDFRIGRILKAWKHPDADTLYVEEGERVCSEQDMYTTYRSDVQVCHQRLSSAFDLLLIQTLTLTPPPKNALLANLDM